MHEAAIAESLLNVILEQAEVNQGKPVVGKVSCGHFYAVNQEVLGFAFEVIVIIVVVWIEVLVVFVVVVVAVCCHLCGCFVCCSCL